MVENQNSAITDRMSDDLKEGNLALLPKNVQPNIQPTLIVNPLRVCDIVEHKSSTGTIFTTPTDKDFYLSNAFVCVTSSPGVSGGHIEIIINGATKRVIVARGQSIVGVAETSVATGNSQLNFSVPIKLDRGSVIVLGTTDDASSVAGGIIGYTVEALRKK